MRIRASILMTALLVGVSAGAACTHPSGHLMVDAPKILPYQAPDIDEITGIDSSEEPAEATGAGSAQPSQQTPPR